MTCAALQLIQMGPAELAEVGLTPPERRRVMDLLREAAHTDGDHDALRDIEFHSRKGDNLVATLGMRSKPTRGQRRQRQLQQATSHGRQTKKSWQAPKTSMDGAYYQAMQLIEGDSDAIRREQMEELARRGASREVLLSFGVAMGGGGSGDSVVSRRIEGARASLNESINAVGSTTRGLSAALSQSFA